MRDGQQLNIGKDHQHHTHTAAESRRDASVCLNFLCLVLPRDSTHLPMPRVLLEFQIPLLSPRISAAAEPSACIGAALEKMLTRWQRGELLATLWPTLQPRQPYLLRWLPGLC